jgi:hypothetical protein
MPPNHRRQGVIARQQGLHAQKVSGVRADRGPGLGRCAGLHIARPLHPPIRQPFSNSRLNWRLRIPFRRFRQDYSRAIQNHGLGDL